LVYPNILEKLQKPDKFKIISGYSDSYKISIKSMELPFISLNGFDRLYEMLYEALNT